MRLLPRRFFAFAWLKFPALFCSTLAIMGSVRAATLIVTSTADSGPGSLRDAVAAAGEGDLIQFDAALNGQTVFLTSGELVINRDITIDGLGPNVLAVSRVLGPPFRIFHILAGHNVTIARLTISGGDADESGFGILNEQSILTIDNCSVRNNQGSLGYGGNGAGIYNKDGTLKLRNSIIVDNFAYQWGGHGFGGGVYSTGDLEISHSTIFRNTAYEGAGGIFSVGSLQISDSTIEGNRAGFQYGSGGGIVSHGTAIISNSTVRDNWASASHDGFATGYDGGIVNDETMTITNSTVSGNYASLDGGGISNSGTLTVNNCTINGNKAGRNGGGIFNGTTGTLEIGNTILNAGTSGANIYNNSGMITSHGYNLSSDDGGGFLTGSGDQINTNPMLGPLQNNGGATLTHLLLTGSPALNAGDPNFSSEILYDQRGPGYARVFDGRIDIGSLELQPTPTPTPVPSATPSPTPSPTSTPSPTPPASPTPTATPASLGNISTRLRVETGDNVLIGGFIITGNMSKKVVLRGIGPSLGGFGLSDPLADPTLELRGTSGALIFQNDDWQDNADQAAQLNALGLAPPDQKESGIVATLTPSAYTAVLAGKNNGAGVGLVEIYDTSQGTGSQLANTSTRGFVRTGNNVMIGGFILGGGSNETRIVVRGIGPSLAQFGLSPALTDPTLELRNADGALLLSNDDWQDDSASAAQLVSRNLAPQHPKESGIFALLPPGAFTAILAGKSGGTGIGLVEIYNVN